ncbi:MAG: Stp1/IreP family PP2C-type Ser/Thr phosphatase [Nitrospirae bacterium]|nr:Stp1/IreP family PP2C-type Ser/Thr phosphatase [Nitrospirota bacterium]
MRLIADGKTDKGLARENNEDNLLVDKELGLFVVADGIGGQSAGEIASKMAIEVIGDYFRRTSAGSDTLIGAFDDRYSAASNRLASGIRLSNQVIYESSKSNASWDGMCTTIASVLLDGSQLSIAHVGDSRVYLVRADSIQQLTDDHSVVSEQLKRGLITKEMAEKSSITNIITRALGQDKSVDVDLEEIDIMDNDRILLCSDGLTTMVKDDVIFSIVKEVDEPEKACSMLIDIANKNGGRDNITVVLVYFYKDNFSFNIKKFFQRR